MWADPLAEAVRAVGAANGDSLLLDAAHGRALLTDSARVVDVCRGLRRAGFTRFVDFTGAHNGDDNFTLYLTLRAPVHAHARLTLNWKWTQGAAYNAQRGAGQPGDKSEAGPVVLIHPSLHTIWSAAAVAEREVFEMLGLPFAGNALEPLLLDMAFAGNPLRNDYEFTPPESFATGLLRERHAAALGTALTEATVGSAHARTAGRPWAAPTDEPTTEVTP